MTDATMTHEEFCAKNREMAGDVTDWREERRIYHIIRFYFRGGSRLITRGLTLAEAQAWCSNPETSSSTCTKSVGRRRTRQMGAWFDGYTEAR